MPTDRLSPAHAVLDLPPSVNGTPQPHPLSVSALDYCALRVLAEGAASIGNQSIAFSSTTEGVSWSVVTDQPAADVVQVPALHVGKYPLLNQVALTASIPVPVPGEPLEVFRTLNVAASGADALFWSDSAVQKFVFPYVASYGGWRAAEQLTTLQNAWNFYTAGAAPVYGLMHVVPSAGEPLGIYQELALVVSEGVDLRAAPLAGYVGAPAIKYAGPGPVDTTFTSQALPPASSRYPGYRVLRAMAEWSDCITSNPQYFVWCAGTGEMQAPTESPTLEPGDVPIPAHTFSVPNERKGPMQVTIAASPGDEQALLGVADAVFWSTGSIQQFLIPYYASVCGFEAPEELRAIVDAWTLNVPSSGPGGFQDPGVGASTVAAGEEVMVYALVHLPRSAWMSEEELAQMAISEVAEKQEFLKTYRSRQRRRPGSPLHGVGVMHRNARGVHLLPLGEFRALYPHYFR